MAFAPSLPEHDDVTKIQEMLKSVGIGKDELHVVVV